MAVAASHQSPSGRSGGPAVDGTGPGGLYLSQMAPASEIFSASVLFCPDRPPLSPLTPTILPSPWFIGHWLLVTALPPLNNASRRVLSLQLSYLLLYLNWPFCPTFSPFSLDSAFSSPIFTPKAHIRHPISFPFPPTSLPESRDFFTCSSTRSSSCLTASRDSLTAFLAV